MILRFAKERAILYTQFRVFQTECFADCSLSLFTHPAEHVFHSESGDALEQVAQGGCRCPILEAFKARLDVALGSLVWWLATLPVKLDDHCGPFQPRPFYDSMIL